MTLVVDRVGFNGAMDFWDAPELGFKSPTGIGIAIDAEVVRGGGYLFFDKDKGQYGGVLDLDIKGLCTVKAIGLLATRMPDGSRGFSFLAIFAVEHFTPINLGLGFRLTGFGGLFGYDRTVSMDALQAGLKTHALDHIMFPPDPVANAPAIISTAAAVFPPARDQIIVGLMAQIAWGAASLVTIELGLVVRAAPAGPPDHPRQAPRAVPEQEAARRQDPGRPDRRDRLQTQARLRAGRPGRVQAGGLPAEWRRGDAAAMG